MWGKSDEVSGWSNPVLQKVNWVETVEAVQEVLDEEEMPECGFSLEEMVEFLKDNNMDVGW